MLKPSITIRYGARHNAVIVDEQTFERNTLSKRDYGFVRNVVIDTLIKCGTVSRRGRR